MKNFFAKIFGMVKNAYTEVKTYWKVPNKAKGEQVNYREFTSFCIGATFSNSVGVLSGYISFTAGCFLVGAIYGISFKDIYLSGFIWMVLSYLMNPLNMLIQDNLGRLSKKLMILTNAICIPLTLIGIGCMFIPQELFEGLMPAFPQLVGAALLSNCFLVYYKMGMWRLLSNKFGKFRSMIVGFSIPCLISFALMVYLPFRDFEYHVRLWTLYLIFQLYNNFIGFGGQVGAIQNVISSNTEERGKIMSIGGFIYSSVPSLVAILLPVFATMMGGFTNIKTWRLLFPIMFVVFGIGTVLFFGFMVKDKIIINVNHKPQINMKKGFIEVLKNKYFWITNLSGLGNSIAAGSVVMMNVLCLYSLRNESLMGLYSGIIGTASIPGLLFAPYLMRKFGKKNLTLFSKLALCICGSLSCLAVLTNSFVVLLIVSYLQILMIGPAAVAGQAMNADMWDYQQWKSGERLEGCSGIFGLILTPFTMIGGMLIPAIYAGLGFTSDWDILFVQEFRNPILYVTAIVGVVAAALTAIPYFFYDLTDAKHRQYMKEIREREGFADEDEEPNAEAAAGVALAGAGAGDAGDMMQPMDFSETDVTSANEMLDAGTDGQDKTE